VSEPVRGPFERALIQTSRDLAEWTTHPDIEMLTYNDGQGEIVGSASLRQYWGEIVRAGQTTVEDVSEPSGLEGRLVRILKERLDGGGSVTYGDDTYDPVWHGKLLAPASDTSGVTNYTASGIAALFNERSCWIGRALVKTPADAANVRVAFDLAPFNHWPSGDRSANQFAVGGVGVYIHDATQTVTGLEWSAAHILGYLLACNFRVEHPPTVDGSGQAGLAWALSDPQGCLNYIPGRYDAKGKTLTQVLHDLAGRRRGLTWFITVSGTTLTINVASGVAQAITVGTTTVPANPNVWDQTDDDDPYLFPVNVRTVSDEVADEIVVQGTPRLIGLTVAIYGSDDPFEADAGTQLDKGWSNDSETLCNKFLDLNPKARRRVAYEHAWRRFVLRPTGWTGDQFGGTGGMPWGLATASDAEYGAGGYDGTVTEGAGGGEKPALWYKAQGELPCAPGFGASNVGPRQPAVVLAEGYDAGTWQDYSTVWTVWVESSPPAVVLDDGIDGTTIRAILRAGRKILVTLALRDFFPFQVSWRRNPADWPNVTPRIKTIVRPELTAEYIMNGATIGCDADAGGDLLTTTKITTRDNLPQLRALLAQARAWYEQPYSLVTMTDRGVWDSNATYRPGTLLGTIINGADSRIIEAMVSRRTVRLEYADGEDGIQVPYWTTTWETDVVYPDLEAVL
jgi:hypothetical protein